MTNLDTYTPYDLTDYVGQATLKRKLGVYINQAAQTKAPLPHMLFAGDPGTGKTALAHLVAAEVGDPIEVIDLSKFRPNGFASFLRRWDGGILFVEEIHKAKPPQQEELLTLMEEGYISTNTGTVIEVPWLTVIAATTEPEKLKGPLVERFQFRPRWDPYSDEECAAIVSGMAERAEVQMPADVARDLGRAAGGTPRMARHLVVAFGALQHEGEPKATDVLDLCDVDQDGLTLQHLEYLRVLDRMDGLSGQGRICNMMRSHVDVVSKLERLLFARDLITFEANGRRLTAAGEQKTRGERRGYQRAS